MIQNLKDAEDYLYSLVNFERQPGLPYARMGLGPIRRLLAAVGDPHERLRVVHVAGSKGKGSTVLLLEAVLREAGERVGAFVSPHLERWTERYRIDGCEVGGDELARAVERLRPHVEQLRRETPEDAPTFFDATTAAGLLMFEAAGVDRVLLEVGLGGRLDSTNVVTPQVTCVTSIELEHTDKLGDTLGEIAGEKAGILKPEAPCVVGALPHEAMAVVGARARELGIECDRLGHEIQLEVLEEGPTGLELLVCIGAFQARAWLPVLGRHQAGNAALAIGCARRLGAHTDEALAAAVEKGLAAAELPARAERLSEHPCVIVDAAHTAASAQALARVLEGLSYRSAHLVLSISAGKDLGGVLEALLPFAERVTLTRAEPTRSLGPAEVAAAVREIAPDLESRVVPNPHLAVRAARESLGPEDLLCVAGSIYIAGIARSVLR